MAILVQMVLKFKDITDQVPMLPFKIITLTKATLTLIQVKLEQITIETILRVPTTDHNLETRIASIQITIITMLRLITEHKTITLNKRNLA